VIDNDLIFHAMMTWHAIWQQGVTNFHGNPLFFMTPQVFVCFEFMAPIFVMA
jgi:hypothetical protein